MFWPTLKTRHKVRQKVGRKFRRKVSRTAGPKLVSVAVCMILTERRDRIEAIILLMEVGRF
ncbi:MAG: hypothetical protein C0508_29620 [Cyanobacteria bacterium PR.023]|nr:hypothetical protein [Cyanobacteria bacterium PR.023]